MENNKQKTKDYSKLELDKIEIWIKNNCVRFIN